MKKLWEETQKLAGVRVNAVEIDWNPPEVNATQTELRKLDVKEVASIIAMVSSLGDYGFGQQAEEIIASLSTEARKRFRPWEDDLDTVNTKASDPVGKGGSKAGVPKAPEDKRKFKYSVEGISKDESTEKVLSDILKCEVTVSVKDLMGVSSEIRTKLIDKMKTRKVYIDGDLAAMVSGEGLMAARSNFYESEGDTTDLSSTPLLVTAATSKINVTVNGAKILAHVDKGSEINLVPLKVVERLGLPVSKLPAQAFMRGAGAHSTYFAGYVIMEVEIQEIVVNAVVFVIESDPNYDLLLGKPFSAATRMVETTNFDGSSRLEMTSPDGTQHLEVVSSKRDDPKNDRRVPRASSVSFGRRG